MALDFYRINKGISFRPLTAPPTNPVDGDVWYDASLSKFQKRENGVTSDLGSGTGNANELLERLKDYLGASPYNYLSANIFAQTKDTELSNLTNAVYSAINATIRFDAIGGQITSIGLLDDDFFALGKDLKQIDFTAFWLRTALDPAASYQVSRDGGANWETASLTRFGTTETFRGVHTFAVDGTQTRDEHDVANADNSRSIDTSGNFKKLAQKVTFTGAEVLKALTIYVTKAGSPIGSVRMKICKDAGPGLGPLDTPAGTVAEGSWIDVTTLPSGASTLTSTVFGVVPAGTYWLVIEPDAVYTSAFVGGNTVSVRTDTSSPPKPTLFTYNGTGWVDTGFGCFTYKIEGRPLDLRVRFTASVALVELQGFGVLYELAPTPAGRPKRREVVQIPALVNTNVFNLNNFVPDPELLEVYVLETGQVFKYGAFAVSGNTVTFPTNFFDSPDLLTLVFEQKVGSVDNSDSNAVLLAANFLGHPTNSAYSRAQAGRGIFLMRPDGTMREITINNNDEIEVFSV